MIVPEDLGGLPVEQREDYALRLLQTLPRSRLAGVQRLIAPLLQFDLVGSLPVELAFHVFSFLPSNTLLVCATVCKRWQALADDPELWKTLCKERKLEWRQPPKSHNFDTPVTPQLLEDEDDEGMGDDEDDHTQVDDRMDIVADDGIASMLVDEPLTQSHSPPRATRSRQHTRHSAPSALPSLTSSALVKPDYKRLHQTYTRLHTRFLTGSYVHSALQTRDAGPGAPAHAHSGTIYCLQLYTHPLTGVQTLFTGSKDRTIREWDLSTGRVLRVISGVHESSVLSVCVAQGWIAEGGSDRRVALWRIDATDAGPVRVVRDHEDSVLCVRFDERRIVTCSKDRTVRVYTFPDLAPLHVLRGHRAAVNAVSISATLIVSGSGDRSVRVWDAASGKALRVLENHHSRGIASIDSQPPWVLSGSSDKHLRVVDIGAGQGWSTSPEYDMQQPGGSGVCQVCGGGGAERPRCAHGDLVRSVALGEDFVVSGSYDLTVKVWDRKTGTLVADLTGGHTGRIFCIGFDRTKVVSCGEDQRICIWDFSHGIDTSFMKL